MTDDEILKLADNEILKALECCQWEIACVDRHECPLRGKNDCFTHLAINALDLIKRQKAEIERLKHHCFGVQNELEAYKDTFNTAIDEAKTEAINEFAERLTNKIFSCDVIGDRDNIWYMASDVHNIIGDLVKEMTESVGK